MSFKMSVLFCVLYLFTVTWSIGLNIVQIRKLLKLSLNHKGNNEKGTTPSDDIINYLSDNDVGYTGDHKKFQNKKSLWSVLSKGFVINNKTMPEFLIMLADNKKSGDSWMVDSLTTYEVKLFVEMFNVQDKLGNHDGLLAVAELNELFDDKLNLQESIKWHIKQDLIHQETMNVVQYLELILKHKHKCIDYFDVEYQHLNKAQIDKCLALYNSSENHLDSIKQISLFKSLNIVSKEYEYLLDFPHVRPAALELQEVLVFWSDYDKNLDIDAPFLTHISQSMWDFNYYDENHDGLLDIQELKSFASDYVRNVNMKAFIEKYLPSGSPPMCAGTFLNMYLSLFPKNYQKMMFATNTAI